MVQANSSATSKLDKKGPVACRAKESTKKLSSAFRLHANDFYEDLLLEVDLDGPEGSDPAMTLTRSSSHASLKRQGSRNKLMSRQGSRRLMMPRQDSYKSRRRSCHGSLGRQGSRKLLLARQDSNFSTTLKCSGSSGGMSTLHLSRLNLSGSRGSLSRGSFTFNGHSSTMSQQNFQWTTVKESAPMTKPPVDLHVVKQLQAWFGDEEEEDDDDDDDDGNDKGNTPDDFSLLSRAPKPACVECAGEAALHASSGSFNSDDSHSTFADWC